MPRPKKKPDTPIRQYQFWWLAAIVVVAALVYIPSLNGSFVLDDKELIIDNPVARSLSQMPKAFTSYFLFGFDKTDALYYRPLVTISYQINNSLSLHDAAACRATNILLNCLMAALVFVLARRMTGNVTLAGIAGLVFAVLPAHAETVAWIAGRTDMIAGAFMLGSFLVFAAAYRKRPEFNWKLAALASLLFACALFSKENALVLPALVAVYVLTLGSSMKRSEALKWLVLAAIPIALYLACRQAVLGSGFGGQMDYLLTERMSRIGYVYAQYLRMMFLPQEMRPVYDGLRIGGVTSFAKVAAFVAPAALIALFVWGRKRSPILAFGAGWMFIALLPVVDIVPVRGLVIAERFVYLPSIGSAVILGWLFSRMLEWRLPDLRTLPMIVGAAAAAFILYCGAVTVTGSVAYKSNLEWARWVHAHQPKLRMIRLTASGFLDEAGYRLEAAQEFEAAIDLRASGLSGAKKAEYKRGLAGTYIELGRYDLAVRSLEDLVKLSPDDPRARRDLARARRLAGQGR